MAGTAAAGARVAAFMCGMNAVRSPMAEALARRMLPAETSIVASAGVAPGERDPFVDAVLDEDRPDARATASRRRWTISRTTIST